MTTVRQKKLQNVSACLLVSLETAPYYILITHQYQDEFETRDIRWVPDGKGLVLLDKETFCCAFEVEDADDAMQEDSMEEDLDA
jgi:hypothetical protein